MAGSPPANCGPFCTYALQVDWNNNGVYTDPNDAITNDVLQSAPISFGYGRDTVRALSPTGPSEMKFTVCNADLTYSPGATGTTGSPISQMILPGRKVQLIVTPTGSSAITGYAGRIDDLTVNTARSDRSVEFQVIDGLAQLKSRVTTAVLQTTRTGTAINAVLDAAGWPANQRDIDPGATVMPWWWGDGVPMDLINTLVACEGPPSICYVDRGIVVFRDRHHRILDAPSLTSQATFCIAGKEIPGQCVTASPCPTGALPYTDPLGYNHGMKNIVNSSRFSVTTRQPDPTFVHADDMTFGPTDFARPIIAEVAANLFIAVGQTKFITIDVGQPFVGAEFPGKYALDILVTSTSGAGTVVGDSISQTSGTRTTIGINNFDSADWIVTRVRLRGQLLLDTGSKDVSFSDATSIAAYGEQPNESSDAPFINEYDADAINQLIVGQRKDRVPQVYVRIINGTQTLQNHISQRRLSDLVTIRSDRLGINDPYYIERVDHSISSLGRLHGATFGCEQQVVVANQATASNAFIFDGGVGHRFNEGVFAL